MQLFNLNNCIKIVFKLKTILLFQTCIPPRFRSDIRKFSGQNAFDDTICAPSFMLANRSLSCFAFKRHTKLQNNFNDYHINTACIIIHTQPVITIYNMSEKLSSVFVFICKHAKTCKLTKRG